MTAILTTRLSTKMFVRVLAAAMAVSGAGLAMAQVPAMPEATEYVLVTRQDLQEVVAPIALYPDALLAQSLVACTYPRDVVAAARWLRDGGDPLWVGFQNWDLSVAGLVHYPEALYLLADNYDWMNQLGAAFIHQREDVMAAVQEVRSRASANGCLVSNEYQNVVVDDQCVQIIPANPDVIYVPVYEPQVILVTRQVIVQPALVVRFGIGIKVGTWLRHDCDWRDSAIYIGYWGPERPWWLHHGRDVGYDHNRPGSFVGPRTVTNVTNVNVVARWERDGRRPAPQEIHTARPVAAPQHSVAAAPANSARLTPAVRERLTAATHETAQLRPTPAPTARPNPNPRPVAGVIDRPAAHPTPAPAAPERPTVRPTPVRETPAAVHPTPAPAAPERPTVHPTPARETPPAARPTPAPAAPERPAARPTPAPEAPPAARPTPAPAIPERPTARTTPVRQATPAVRPTPMLPRAAAPAPATVRPAPTREFHSPAAARAGSATGRPTAPGADTPNRDSRTAGPRGR